MKRFFITFYVLMLLSCSVFGQNKVTIKGGTMVPVEAVRNVRAVEVHVGQNVDFQVVRDVVQDGVVVIPTGTIVKGNVFEAKRSTAFGTKGRLGIKLTHLNLPSGDVVNFSSSEVYIQGKNRTPLSVVIFLFTCLPFPCGSKAELKTGVEYEARVANNTLVTLNY